MTNVFRPFSKISPLYVLSVILFVIELPYKSLKVITRFGISVDFGTAIVIAEFRQSNIRTVVKLLIDIQSILYIKYIK